MQKLKEFIEKNKSILAVIFFCLFIRLFLYRPDHPGWDESTYIQIGKYLFSAGQIGFLESFRPIVWPFLLGLCWKSGLDPIISGYILTILFSLGSLVLVYCIGKKVYGAPAGILAALLFGISPSFFFWGNSILTEIPALFLGLLSVYYALNKRYLLSGIMGMPAFFTKFTQSLNVMAVGAWIALGSARKMILRPVANYVLGCAVVFGMAMFCFFLLYGDIFLPFARSWLIYTAYSQLIFTQTHYSWFQGVLYVLGVLPRVENWLLVFALANLFFTYRDQGKGNILLLGLGILQLAWIGKYPADVSRFLLMALPYLYLLTANGILQSYEFLRNRGLKFLLAAIVFIQAGIQCYETMAIRFPPDRPTVFQRYIKSREVNIRGSIWISNPTMLTYSNLKADERMYYPVFNSKKISDLSLKLNQADFIFMDSRDLRCPPQDFTACDAARGKLFETIRRDFHADLYWEEPSGNRIFGVFRKERGAG